jgi:hypothetical protein
MHTLGTSILVALLLCTAGCGGAIEGDAPRRIEDPPGVQPPGTPKPPAVGVPPAVNTRFVLRIDGRQVDLEPPTGSQFVVTASENRAGYTYIQLSAEENRRGGDFIRSAQVTLNEAYAARSFDCTPNEHGVSASGASLDARAFLGFTPTISECLVEVTYISADRAVGVFSAKATPPPESSLAGKVATIAGEFDVPFKRVNLP